MLKVKPKAKNYPTGVKTKPVAKVDDRRAFELMQKQVREAYREAKRRKHSKLDITSSVK